VTGEAAERLAVASLRLLAATFAAVGIVFIALPDSLLEWLTDFGDSIGSFTAAPPSDERLWLALGFAYMVVIAGICLVVSLDVARYRPFLLVLAAGKAASSLASLGFYAFSSDVFAYLLNFIVDGLLVGVALWLWTLAGRAGEPAAPSSRRAPGLRAAELRTLRAFAEAMAPGVGALPAALGNAGEIDGRVDVAATIQRFLTTAPARSVRRIGLALRGVEWLSFPRRFSRADVETRQELLARLESSRFQLVHDVILYMKVLAGLGYANDARVRAAVGSEARCAVAGGEPRSAPEREPQPLGELTPPPDGEECDVAVVGSGAGGAVAAAVLAEAGLDVVVLEAGRYLDRDNYPEEPVAALRALYRDGGLTVCEGRPAIPTPVGRAVGGTTVINSGTCLRAPGDVLASWVAEHGVEWASDLDEEYEAAERVLAVAPVDPDRMGRNGQLLRGGAEALGARHEPLRRNAGRCVQCSSCPQGCRLDAKRAMHVSYLPRAVAAGARVRAGVEVRRIELRGRRAHALECLASDADPEANGRPPRRLTVRPRHGIVLAGGAFGTPELLLRSGFRSPGGQVGRNLRIHPACWVGARFDEEVRGWDGVMQSYAVTEWEPQGLLLEATFTPLAFGAQWLPGTGLEHARRVLAYDHVASTGVHLSDRSSGRVRLTGDGSLRLTYKLLRDDARRLAFGIARAAELFYAAGAVEVYPQISSVPTLGRADIHRLESSPPPTPALRLEAFHPMGTARIDADPRRGAVAPDGSLHGADGAWVADGSLLPSSIGVNPMMTIIAMASKVAKGIAERLS